MTTAAIAIRIVQLAYTLYNINMCVQRGTYVDMYYVNLMSREFQVNQSNNLTLNMHRKNIQKPLCKQKLVYKIYISFFHYTF